MDGLTEKGNFVPERLARVYKMITALPAGVEVENYWFYSISYLAYSLILVLHVLWLATFYYLGQTTMAYAQLFSIATYAIALTLNRRGNHMLAATIAVAEVNLHQAIAVIILGWNAGFQNFIPLIALLPFLKYNESWWKRIGIGVGCLLFYLYIEKVLKNSLPLFPLPAVAFKSLSISNTVLCFLLVALWGIVLAISYRRAVTALIQKETEVFALQKAGEQAEILRQLDLKERDNEIYQLRFIELKDKNDEILEQKRLIEELVVKQEIIIHLRTQEIAEANAKLVDANKKLVELIQYNSHHLREPLTRVMGAMGIYEDMTTEEFHRDIWPQMERAVSELDERIRSVVRIAEETYKLYS